MSMNLHEINVDINDHEEIINDGAFQNINITIVIYDIFVDKIKELENLMLEFFNRLSDNQMYV